MKAHLEHCRLLADYKKGGKVHVHDRMCKRPFSYRLAAAPGEGYRIPGKFMPKYTPVQMLVKGIFGGKYLNDCMDSSRPSGSRRARGGKLSPSGRDRLSSYGTESGQPLTTWRSGLVPAARRGWFSGTAATTWAGAS